MNQTNSVGFFEIYKSTYSKMAEDKFFIDCFDKDGFNPDFGDKFSWNDLDISLTIEKIKEIAEKHNLIQLRPITGNEKLLVVGCGNKPLVDMGGYVTMLTPGYQEAHHHHEAVTINPHLGFNPTLGGFFGKQDFPMLKDHQFDLIVLEGVKIPDTEIGRKELARILSPTGTVVTHNGIKAYLFNWETQGKQGDCGKEIDLSGSLFSPEKKKNS